MYRCVLSATDANRERYEDDSGTQSEKTHVPFSDRQGREAAELSNLDPLPDCEEADIKKLNGPSNEVDFCDGES